MVKVLENESIFQNVSDFQAAKTNFLRTFSRKKNGRKAEDILVKFIISSKNYFKNFNFLNLSNSGNLSMKEIIYFTKLLIKTRKNLSYAQKELV